MGPKRQDPIGSPATSQLELCAVVSLREMVTLLEELVPQSPRAVLGLVPAGLLELGDHVLDDCLLYTSDAADE